METAVPNRSYSVTGTVLLLGAGLSFGLVAAALAQSGPSTATRPAESGRNRCEAMADSRLLTYRNPRFGFTMTYPAGFVLDPESVPENGDSARFWTADHQATAVFTGVRNGLNQGIEDLMREARAEVTSHSHGTITYARQRDDWFVLSGYLGNGRIFYQRSALGQGSKVIGHLWIEFPRDLKPCFEAAVTTMSLSFHGPGP